MIESFGSRPLALSVAAAPVSPADEKVVHRPDTVVLAVEKVDRNAQTGPRPAFDHTYLERVAAFWPDEPNPRGSLAAYERPPPAEAPAPPAAEDAPPPADDDDAATAEPPAPQLDIRR